MTRTLLLSALAGALIATPAAAHIVLAETEAAPGAYYAGAFRVSHGCDGSPTVRLRIAFPEELESAKPQPKPGWTIRIETAPLAEPRATEGGEVTERVSAIVWEGRLEDAYFDTFGVMMKLPATPGPLYFPVTQTCESGETAWTEIPPVGAAWNSVPHPAPVLNVAGAAPSGHAH